MSGISNSGQLEFSEISGMPFELFEALADKLSVAYEQGVHLVMHREQGS
jgi:hypothetical protein